MFPKICGEIEFPKNITSKVLYNKINSLNSLSDINSYLKYFHTNIIQIIFTAFY